MRKTEKKEAKPKGVLISLGTRLNFLMQKRWKLFIRLKKIKPLRKKKHLKTPQNKFFGVWTEAGIT